LNVLVSNSIFRLVVE